MGNEELELIGTRVITIDKSGKKETQKVSIYVIGFNKEINDSIVNSEDPFEEWSKYIRDRYNHNTPIYIWDLKENYGKPEIIEREEAFFESGNEEANPEDIVGYRNLGDEFIADLKIEMQEAIDNDYDLEWIISY